MAMWGHVALLSFGRLDCVCSHRCARNLGAGDTGQVEHWIQNCVASSRLCAATMPSCDCAKQGHGSLAWGSMGRRTWPLVPPVFESERCGAAGALRASLSKKEVTLGDLVANLAMTSKRTRLTGFASCKMLAESQSVDVGVQMGDP